MADKDRRELERKAAVEGDERALFYTELREGGVDLLELLLDAVIDRRWAKKREWLAGVLKVRREGVPFLVDYEAVYAGLHPVLAKLISDLMREGTIPFPPTSSWGPPPSGDPTPPGGPPVTELGVSEPEEGVIVSCAECPGTRFMTGPTRSTRDSLSDNDTCTCEGYRLDVISYDGSALDGARFDLPVPAVAGQTFSFPQGSEALELNTFAEPEVFRVGEGCPFTNPYAALDAARATEEHLVVVLLGPGWADLLDPGPHVLNVPARTRVLVEGRRWGSVGPAEITFEVVPT